jgi:hypothetical protein
LPAEQAEKLRKMSNDLRWLVMEGYVTEFADGKLFAPPAMAPQSAKKSDSGDDDHDPIDFPDAPGPAAVAAPAKAEAAPAEVPAEAPEAAVTEPAAPEPAPSETNPESAAPAPSEPIADQSAEAPKPETQP